MFKVLLCGFLSTLIMTASARFSNYTLLSQLSRQSETLAHGLELANRVGNIGGRGYHGMYGRVGFLAATTSSKTYSGSKNVLFPQVVTNVGNAFYSSTGYFKAPYDGLYVFEWSLMNYNSGNVMYPGLYVNGGLKLRAYCYSYSSYHGTCSKTAPLQLKRGDLVSIRAHSSTLYVHSAYSSFSGWML